MREKLRRLANLSCGEWALLPQLILAAALVGAGTRLVALPRLIEWLSRCATHPWLRLFPVNHRQHHPEKLASLAGFATRFTQGRQSCLPYSLLLLWLLRARGEPADLLIGVNREAGIFHGHAWIEAGGRVLGDSLLTTTRFITILRY